MDEAKAVQELKDALDTFVAVCDNRDDLSSNDSVLYSDAIYRQQVVLAWREIQHRVSLPKGQPQTTAIETNNVDVCFCFACRSYVLYAHLLFFNHLNSFVCFCFVFSFHCIRWKSQLKIYYLKTHIWRGKGKLWARVYMNYVHTNRWPSACSMPR